MLKFVQISNLFKSMLAKIHRNYLIGISWFILSLFISCINDVIVKYVSYSLHPFEVAFFRFLFGTLSLLPIMLYYGRKSFSTSRPIIHFMRGAILFVAISIWCIGLNIVPIVSATLLTFTIPLFILILAPIFLGEKVKLELWILTVVGFIGIILIFQPTSADFNPMSLIMLGSAFLFALLDIINKKFVIKESMLSMLFYSAIVTTLLGLFPALYFWQNPTLHDLILMLCLGAGSNLILFCLLKGFALVAVSEVAPYRYLEVVFSALFGYIIFIETPGFYTYLGALIIIPTTLFIAKRQLQN